MSNESNNTTIEEELVECETCGCVSYLLVKESPTHFTYIRCAQCNKIFGLAEKTKY